MEGSNKSIKTIKKDENLFVNNKNLYYFYY